MTDIIKDAKQLLEGATPGPWEVDVDGLEVYSTVDGDAVAHAQAPNDAECIAAAVYGGRERSTSKCSGCFHGEKRRIMSYFDEIIKSTDLPEGVDYIQLTSQITDNEIFTIADYVAEDDDGFPIPLGEVHGDKLIPMVIIGLDSLYDSMPDGEHKLEIARVSLGIANLRYQEELRKMKDNEEEK